MAFDPAAEMVKELTRGGFQSGKEYIEAIIEDAKANLPPNTDFQFYSWTDGQGKRRTGWAYNVLTPRGQQKAFNPLKIVLRA